MKDSKIKKVKDFKNNKIAILKDKTSKEGYIIPKEIIKKYKLDDYNTIKKYSSYQEMLADLYSGDIDAIFINSDYGETYSTIGAYENIKDETRVVLKLAKKVCKKNQAKPKDYLVVKK